MSVMEIDDNLNVRTMSKYFKNVLKAANYNEDTIIKFPALHKFISKDFL